MVYGTHPKLSENDQEAYRSFRDLDLTLTSARRTLKDIDFTFDCIAVTGVSGLSLGAPLALALKKTLLVLRKEEEQCHGRAGELIGANDLTSDSRVLIVDDLISGGTTCCKIIDAIAANNPDAKVVGAYMYEGDYVWDEHDLKIRVGR